MISSSQNLDMFAMFGIAVISIVGLLLIIYMYTRGREGFFLLRTSSNNTEEEENEEEDEEENETDERVRALQIELQNYKAGLQEKEEKLKNIGVQNKQSSQKLRERDEDIKRQRKENDDLLARLQQQDGELKRYREENVDLHGRLSGKDDELHRKSKEHDDLLRGLQNQDKEIQRHIAENNDLRRSLSEEKSQRETIQRSLEKEREDKEEALRRLSAIMSSRLKDGNPNVVDLNDQNRPTKIGEKYSELYDNEWTDAYSELESMFGDNEQQIIDILRFILEQCFGKCVDNATAQLDNFRQGIETVAGSIAAKSKTLTNDMMQRLKEERKAFATDCQPNVQSVGQAIAQSLAVHVDSLEFLQHPCLQAYIEQCVRLCWFMVIQDPPMVLISNPRENPSHFFRSYLHNGPYLKFVVWPALLLSDQGSLVMKGTAEFIKQEQ